MKNALFLILFSLSLAGCGHDAKDGGEATSSSYKYSLNDNGCKTEKSLSSKQEYCNTLEDETANKGCALSDREALYKRDCGSDFKETNPLTP